MTLISKLKFQISKSIHLQPSAKDTTESGISVNRAVDDKQSIVEDLSQDPPTKADQILVVVICLLHNHSQSVYDRM